jgi:hypothetical protein
MTIIDGQLESVMKLIDAANEGRSVNLDDVLAVNIKRGAKMLGVSDRHFRKQLDIEGGGLELSVWGPASLCLWPVCVST